MKVVVWGLGTNGRNFIDVWGKKKVVAIVDSNPIIREKGKYCGIPLVTCEEIEKKYMMYPIIVTPMFYKEIVNWIEEKKIKKYYVLCESKVRLDVFKGLMEGKFDDVLQINNNLRYVIKGESLFAECLREYLVNKKKDIFFNEKEKKGKKLIINCDSFKNKKNEIDYKDLNEIIHLRKKEKLEKFHNIHKGERIFIVATGPSITTDDLEVLRVNNEICISMNSIFFMYDKVNWRPNYYVASDGGAIREFENNMHIAQDNSIELFFSDNYLNLSNQIKCHIFRQVQNSEKIEFSHDFSEDVYSGSTVVYACLQLAVYMGVKEIYLLGCDFSFSNDLGSEENHCCGQKYDTYTFNFEFVEKAYKKAREETEKVGIKIYNATRGGKLEIFPRIDFDSIFEDKVTREDIKC